jgi:hypothetical protein
LCIYEHLEIHELKILKGGNKGEGQLGGLGREQGGGHGWGFGNQKAKASPRMSSDGMFGQGQALARAKRLKSVVWLVIYGKIE